MNESFAKELERLINRYSVDAYLGVPDFIISENIVAYLESLNKMLFDLDKFRK